MVAAPAWHLGGARSTPLLGAAPRSGPQRCAGGAGTVARAVLQRAAWGCSAALSVESELSSSDESSSRHGRSRPRRLSSPCRRIFQIKQIAIRATTERNATDTATVVRDRKWVSPDGAVRPTVIGILFSGVAAVGGSVVAGADAGGSAVVGRKLGAP